MPSWHQETRDRALRKSQHLATNIAVKLSRAHANDSDDRLGMIALSRPGKKLEVEYEIPNAASPLTVTIDQMGHNPRWDGGQRAPARVDWLPRQSKSANDDHVLVGIRWPSRCHDTVCRLTELRDDPKSIVRHAARPPGSFEVF